MNKYMETYSNYRNRNKKIQNIKNYLSDNYRYKIKANELKC